MAKLIVEFSEKGAKAVTKSLNDVTESLKNMPAKAKDTVENLSAIDKVKFAAVVAGLEALGLAAVGVAKQSVTMASDFDQGVRKVNTLLDSNAQASQDWGQVYKDTAVETGQSLESVTEATYSALSAGVDYENVQQFVIDANKLSVGGFTSLEGAIDTTTSVLNAYGLEAEDMDRISNTLINTQNLGKTTVDELGASLSQVTPTAAALGVNFDQVGSALAVMTAQGTPTAQATTQLNSLLAELGKSGTKASGIFEELSGQSFQDFIASGGDVGEAMSLMSKYADDNNISMLDMFGSLEAGKAALAISSDAEGFNNAMATMESRVDSATLAFDEMTEGSLAFQQQQLASSLEVLGVTIGEYLIPYVAIFVDKLQAMVTWMIENEKIVKIIAIAIGLLASAFIVLNTIMAIYTVATTLAAAAEAALLAPIILIVVTVIAVIAVIVLLISYWDELIAILKKVAKAIWEFIVDTFNKLKDFLAKFGQWLVDNWETILTILLTILFGFFGLIIGLIIKNRDQIVETVKALWDKVKQLFEAGKNLVIAIVTAYVNLVKAQFTFMKETAIAIVTAMWNLVKAGFELGKNTVVNIVTFLKTSVINIFNGVKNGISSVINGIISVLNKFVNKVLSVKDSVVSAFKNIVSGISVGIQTGIDTLIANVKSGVNNFAINPLNLAIGTINKIPGVNIPNIPALAKGGIVGVGNNGIFANIGEAGPEAVIPLKDAVLSKIGKAIYDSTTTNNVTNSNSKIEANFYITGDDPESIVDQVEEALRILALKGGLL